MELDYDRDVNIDESALDVECLAQPRLMLKYGQASARASKAADLAKEALEVVKAELDEGMRKDPDKYGLAKVTDAVVAQAILKHERYIEANHDFIQAKYEASMARVGSTAIDARKDSLEYLIKLHGQQYFAGPSVPRDLGREWTKRQQQLKSNGAVSASLQRRK